MLFVIWTVPKSSPKTSVIVLLFLKYLVIETENLPITNLFSEAPAFNIGTSCRRIIFILVQAHRCNYILKLGGRCGS